MTDRLAPAVLAEDLRALADQAPFDAKTARMLEQAADALDGREEADPPPSLRAAARAVVEAYDAGAIVVGGRLSSAMTALAGAVEGSEPSSLERLTECVELALEVACKHVELYDVQEDGTHVRFDPPDDARLLSPLARIVRCLRSAGLLDEHQGPDTP